MLKVLYTLFFLFSLLSITQQDMYNTQNYVTYLAQL